MKTGLATLLLLASCEAAAIQPRQAPKGVPAAAPKAGGAGGLGGLLGGLTTPIKFSNKVTLKPQLRANAKREKVRWGPYVLKAKGSAMSIGSLDPNGQSAITIITEGIPRNATILSGLTGLEYEDGTAATPANGVYIHHILSSDLSKPLVGTVSLCDAAEVKLPTSNLNVMGAGFIGGSEDTGEPLMFTSQDGKYKSGFLTGANDTYLLQTDLVNYNPVPKTVYITFDMEYVDGHDGVDAVPNLISVTGCKLALPKTSKEGPAVTKSQKFTILVDGEIIAMKGHMHNGADRMELSLNGKELCTSKARYNAEGVINSMSTCDKAIPVKRGDYIEMSSVYDLKAHPLRAGTHGGDAHTSLGGEDVMGMWTMTFALTKKT